MQFRIIGRIDNLMVPQSYSSLCVDRQDASNKLETICLNCIPILNECSLNDAPIKKLEIIPENGQCEKTELPLIVQKDARCGIFRMKLVTARNSRLKEMLETSFYCGKICELRFQRILKDVQFFYKEDKIFESDVVEEVDNQTNFALPIHSSVLLHGENREIAVCDAKMVFWGYDNTGLICIQ